MRPCAAKYEAAFRSIQPQSESRHCVNRTRRKTLTLALSHDGRGSRASPALLSWRASLLRARLPCSAQVSSLLSNNREGACKGLNKLDKSARKVAGDGQTGRKNKIFPVPSLILARNREKRGATPRRAVPDSWPAVRAMSGRRSGSMLLPS